MFKSRALAIAGILEEFQGSSAVQCKPALQTSRLKIRNRIRFASTLVLAAVFQIGGADTLLALEYPVGEPHLTNGMEIAAVYLQPIEMDPPGMMTSADKSDIHLEADIHATSDNRNGFAEGDWLPNLNIAYRLIRIDGGSEISGVMMPMVASDGPHYGDNVKLKGPGRYRLQLTINSESHDGGTHFGRHVDKETGVAPWPKVISVDYEFAFAGIGKKGGY